MNRNIKFFHYIYLESISIMRYNKRVNKYRIFGDGCNSLPAVFVSDEAAIYERTNLVT